jgi:hypothetical protein
MIAHYDMFHDKTPRTVSSLLVLWDGVAAGADEGDDDDDDDAV